MTQSNDMSPYLAGARNMLRMNVKTLARVVRMSDRVISELEQKALPEDPRAQTVKRALEDYGIVFTATGNGDLAVSLDGRAGRKRITFAGCHNIAEAVERFQRAMSFVGKLGWQPIQLDRSKGSGDADSVDIFVPIKAQQIAKTCIGDFISSEGPVILVNGDGSKTVVNADQLDLIFN